jgi:acyl-phosphate glycerol 3-phosphate acyltransferase
VIDRVLPALFVLAAYLIGAIPFGYLVARARGIDIRTVGSGNIGATNVGRTLGFRFFVLVFVLDLLKGFLPAVGFPRLAEGMTGHASPALGVLAALAAILGHNFPIYLRFRGGKGVATSLGALLALDPVAALSSAAGFGVSMLLVRMVSVSSLLGGAVFAVVHFARTAHPRDRDQIAMSLLTFGLLALLVVRHRKNLARVWAGTEPKVALRRKKRNPATPTGRITGGLLLAVLAVGLMAAAGLRLTVRAMKPAELRLGTCTLMEVTRVATGHQRAEQLAFADGGRALAVTCPRYNRVVFYRVAPDATLETRADVDLDGRPVAIGAVDDRVYVLERPPGVAKHLEPGYLETFRADGVRVGGKLRVGFYPDDLAITPDGRHALILTSGRSEGGPHRPLAALSVVALERGPGPRPESGTAPVVGRVEFVRPGVEPDRRVVSADGRRAAKLPFGSERPVAIDISTPERPRIARDDEAGLTPSHARDPDGVTLELPGLGPCFARVRPDRGGLELFDGPSGRPIGRLPLWGPLNLNPARPMGVATAPGRGLIAVATRSGTVHLVAIRPDQGADPGNVGRAVAASESAVDRR